MTSYGKPFGGGPDPDERTIPLRWKTLVIAALILGAMGAGGVVSSTLLHFLFALPGIPFRLNR